MRTDNTLHQTALEAERNAARLRAWKARCQVRLGFTPIGNVSLWRLLATCNDLTSRSPQQWT